MQPFGGTVHGVHLTQYRYPGRLFSAKRISAMGAVTTRQHRSIFPFQPLSYLSLFCNLEVTEQASQPERTDILASLSTVGTGFDVQGSGPFLHHWS